MCNTISFLSGNELEMRIHHLIAYLLLVVTVCWVWQIESICYNTPVKYDWKLIGEHKMHSGSSIFPSLTFETPVKNSLSFSIDKREFVRTEGRSVTSRCDCSLSFCRVSSVRIV
jgi:hypothetical protein